MVIAVAVVFGLLIGSFLNVVVARVPAGESLSSPPSRCPSCQAPIRPRDNVPVLSWLLLRGRARCCGTAISRRYPLVEAGTGLAFGLVTAWVWVNAGQESWPVAGHGLFHPAAVMALLAFLCGAAVRMGLGGLALWAGYRLLHAVHPRGMAYGDVRLAALIGGYLAWLGWAPLAVGAFLGFLLGALGGALLMVLRGAGPKTQIPYGPYMLLGTWIALVAGAPLGRAYLALVGL